MIDDETTREPDAIVAAGADFDPDSLTVDDPLIIVEVVSPDSVKRDTVEKLTEYFSLPTVQHYLVVWQVEERVDHYARDAKGATTLAPLRTGDVLRFDPPGFEVSVTELLAVS